MDVLRVAAAGSVDDGKSTTIGRLLYDLGALAEDQLKALERASRANGAADLDLSLITDGLAAERERRITIDVAYRYFSTEDRRYVLADCPGHAEFTRNMITACSTADAVVVVVDASRGVFPQTLRHLAIAALAGLRQVIVAVNKMDLVGYSRQRFEELAHQIRALAGRWLPELSFVPISAAKGDNVVHRTSAMGWWTGPTLLEALQQAQPFSAGGAGARFIVQIWLDPHEGLAAGRVLQGAIRQGQELVLAAGDCPEPVVVEGVRLGEDEVEQGFWRESLTLRLSPADPRWRGRALLADPATPPVRAEAVLAEVFYFGPGSLASGRRLLVRHATGWREAVVESVEGTLNLEDLELTESQRVATNDVARVRLAFSEPAYLDRFEDCRGTGSLVLADPETRETIGAATVRSVEGGGCHRPGPSQG